MPEQSEDPREYTIGIEYTDGGFALPLKVEEWREIARENFASFDTIRKFWSSSPRSLRILFWKVLKK